MEGSEPSLVPQWLKNSGNLSQFTSSPYSDHINYSGRNWQGRDWEKDIDNLFHKDKLFLGQCKNDGSDYVNKTLSNMFEKDRLQRSKSMNSGKWKEALFHRTSETNHGRTNGRVNGVVGRMYKSVLDEEFPSLGAEDKHSTSKLERVLSFGSSTSSHSLLTDTSANDSASTSVSPRTMALNMAETLAQRLPNSHTPPQLSVSTQKLEELALKKSRLLIPVTPSTPRSLSARSSEKSKVKSPQVQYPFLHSHSPSHSLHGAHPNSHIQKIISGNSHDVSASRELHGVSLAAKDNLSPTASSSISCPSRSTSNSTPSAWITLEKKPTFQTQSRSAFLKNLSRKSSSKKPSEDAVSIGMSCALEKSEATSTRNDISCLSLNSRDAPSVDTSVENSLTENNSIIIARNGNDPGEPSKFSSNGEQRCSNNQVLYSEEEEIAFLRSLGWEESGGDEEGLTEEEIRDFYEKYAKLQLRSNIHQIVHQNRIVLPMRNVVELH